MLELGCKPPCPGHSSVSVGTEGAAGRRRSRRAALVFQGLIVRTRHIFHHIWDVHKEQKLPRDGCCGWVQMWDGKCYSIVSCPLTLALYRWSFAICTSSAHAAHGGCAGQTDPVWDGFELQQWVSVLTFTVLTFCRAHVCCAHDCCAHVLPCSRLLCS